MRLNSPPLHRALRRVPPRLLACHLGHLTKSSARAHDRVRLAMGGTAPKVKRKHIYHKLRQMKVTRRKSLTNICPLFSLNL